MQLPKNLLNQDLDQLSRDIATELQKEYELLIALGYTHKDLEQLDKVLEYLVYPVIREGFKLLVDENGWDKI